MTPVDDKVLRRDHAAKGADADWSAATLDAADIDSHDDDHRGFGRPRVRS